MTQQQQLNEGDTFFIGPKRYRVEGGVPVEMKEERGPLGGIIENLAHYVRLKPGHAFAAIHSEVVEGRSGYMVNVGGLKMALDLEQARQIMIETEIPTHQPTTPQQRRVDELEPGDEVWVRLHYQRDRGDAGRQFKDPENGHSIHFDSPADVVYTYPKAPAQSTGQHMTAAEASKLPGIVGRLVLVHAKVYESILDDEDGLNIGVIVDGTNHSHWLRDDAEITLLPEVGDAN